MFAAGQCNNVVLVHVSSSPYGSTLKLPSKRKLVLPYSNNFHGQQSFIGSTNCAIYVSTVFDSIGSSNYSFTYDHRQVLPRSSESLCTSVGLTSGLLKTKTAHLNQLARVGNSSGILLASSNDVTDMKHAFLPVEKFAIHPDFCEFCD